MIALILLACGNPEYVDHIEPAENGCALTVEPDGRIFALCSDTVDYATAAASCDAIGADGGDGNGVTWSVGALVEPDSNPDAFLGALGADGLYGPMLVKSDGAWWVGGEDCSAMDPDGVVGLSACGDMRGYVCEMLASEAT